MRRVLYGVCVVLLCIGTAFAAWDKTKPADDRDWDLVPGDIRANWAVLETVLGLSTGATDANIVTVMNVKAFGATGDGATDDTTALTAAEAAADDSGGILWLPAGDYELTDDMTISSNVTLLFSPGATISIATTKTLTINGKIAPTMQRIFVCNGTGAVVLGIGSVDRVYPQWWGGVPDAVTNSLAACQAAAIAASAAKAPLYFSGGTWVAAGEIVDDLHISIKGEGPDRSIVDVNDYDGSVFMLNDNSAVENLEIRGDGYSYGAVAIDEGTYSYLCRFRNLRFRDIGCGIDLQYCWGSTIEDIFGVNIGKGIELNKFNGGVMLGIYFNNIYDVGIRIQDSRAFDMYGIILENSKTDGKHRLMLQGVEGATLDGFYTESDIGNNASDIFMGTLTGIGATQNVVVRNWWYNSAPPAGTTYSPIYCSSTDNIRIEDVTWYGLTATSTPCLITLSSNNLVRVKNWIHDTPGDTTIPIANDNRYVMVADSDDFTSTLLTAVDGSGNYPRIDSQPMGQAIRLVGAYRPQKALATVTAIYTIDLDDDASTADYQFDDDAANTTEQVITLTGALPAYAELVSCQLRCFETVTGSTAMSIDVGTSSGGDEILAAANTDSANDINTTAATAGPELGATNAARSIYVNATPGANWSSLDAGGWALMVTYIDYGAVYTQRGP